MNPHAAERMKELTDKLKQGVRDVFESDRYAAYLQTVSKFHSYSFRNVILILMQYPEASRVAGFNTWKKLGRTVKKGQKGIAILAPITFKRMVESDVIDPQTHTVVRDANGDPVKEAQLVKMQSFKIVHVFDLSQTKGRELPSLGVDELTGDVSGYDAILNAVTDIAPVPVHFRSGDFVSKGCYSHVERCIYINEGMSEVQTVKTAIHETAHSILHKREDDPEADEYDVVDYCDIPMLFTNERIDQARLPDGLCCYDLRGSDDDPGRPAAIEERVGVNHAGCLITATPIDIPDCGYIPLGDDLNFTGDSATIWDYWRDTCPDRLEKSQNTREVEAESIAYVVCQHFGIDTSDYSFAYVTSWSRSKELDELTASLDCISSTAAAIIDGIEERCPELRPTEPEPVAQAPKKRNYSKAM